MLNRRRFLRIAGAVGLAVASRPLIAHAARSDRPPPNVLLIMTDQSRVPVWYPPGFPSALPTRTGLARDGVVFRDFYVNSIPCSPNRASMFTGLHAHQHWLLDNVQDSPSLDTGFPTIGSMLRDNGYRTYYFGKWHLTNHDDFQRSLGPEGALQPYGFDVWRPQSGPIARDYEGSPNEGFEFDDTITDSVVQWMASPDADSRTNGPWLAVASLINPHDASYYPASTEELIATLKANGEWVDYGVDVPPNYEPLDRLMSNKPAAQGAFVLRSWQQSGQITRMRGVDSWCELQNYYLWLEAHVDEQLGRITHALRARTAVLANTVVIYVSDHGELAGSHGMKGKGCTMYEEQNHIPCTIADYSGQFMPPAQAGTKRRGFASSIDLVPSMLEFAGVSPDDFPHLAGNSVAPALADTGFTGVPYLLATADSFLMPSAPSRVLHYHDSRWKIGLYNNWLDGTDEPDPAGEEGELYDLDTRGGRVEIDNVAATQPEFAQLRDNLMNHYRTEVLAAALPPPLNDVQQRARATYLDFHAEPAETERAWI